jgi:hypothetical protein
MRAPSFSPLVVVNSLLIAPFIGRVVTRYIGWSKKTTLVSQITKILCEERRRSIKILRSFWWIVHGDIVVSRRNARTTDY